MKFQIRRNPYNDTVDVRLHDDTKHKIKRFLAWSTYGATIAGALAYMRHDNKKHEETPQLDK